MTFKHNDIVLHVHDYEAVGIIQHGEVEWWNLRTDRKLIVCSWTILQYESFLKPLSIDTKLPPNFLQRTYELQGLEGKTNNDSPLIRKIKALDYKWELKMKAKGSFFLTSRAPNVDQETISPSTQTGTATASGVPTTPPLPRSSTRRAHFMFDEIPF